jgi:hypothetical protein
MGKPSRRHQQRKRYDDFLNDKGAFTFDGGDNDGALRATFAHLLFIQFFSLFLYYAFLLDDLTFGCKGKETKRERDSFDKKVGNKLSDYFFRRVYRMERSSFNKLFEILEPSLERIFFPRNGGTRKANKSRYLIDTKTRLSIAIRFFAGADPLDIMQVHDVSLMSVYYSVWGVVDALNACEELRYTFPNHEEQEEIARGFGQKSGAAFSKVIGAIDGLVICIMLPCLAICRSLECGQVNFRCHRKDKHGLNFQAICDHRLKFIWVGMKWPGATSDYMAWVTSALCRSLEDNPLTKKIRTGFTFVGDNAYVKKMFMAVPLKGVRGGYEDAYNFYLSQLRITIERAFGVLVHRWSILRAPLALPLQKVGPLVESLVRLHNFCIDQNDNGVISVQDANVQYLKRAVKYSQLSGSDDSELVNIDASGRPTS